MKRIMKSSLIFLVMGFSLNSYSATIPAQTFSRANCKSLYTIVWLWILQ